jgi:hypothetical protein
MNVISIDPVEKEKRRHRAELLEVLDEMRKQIEQGNIVEFVAVSMCDDGEPQIHSLVSDLPTAVGLFELGKHMIIQQEAY